MLDAAVKALTQMFSPPFRTLLLKCVGLAIVALLVFGVGLYQLIGWLTAEGGTWAQGSLGPTWQTPIKVLLWILAFVAALGLIAGAVFLMPAVTAFVGGFFTDDIAEQVERTYYPADPPGRALPIARAVFEGLKTAGLALLIYLCAVPFVFFAGLGLVVLFFANAYLLGREYFLLAAMRFHSAEDAKALRRAHSGRLFVAGMFIAAFVSVPIVNLATPLFGTAFMVHVYKRVAGGPRRELIEPGRQPR
jgi:CysZ protein